MRFALLASLCIAALLAAGCASAVNVDEQVAAIERGLISQGLVTTDCDIRLYLVVDTSGSVKAQQLSDPISKLVRAVSYMVMRWGGAVTLIGFASDAEVKFANRLSSGQVAKQLGDEAKLWAEARCQTGGATNLLLAFKKVDEEMSKITDQVQNVVLVLSDGEPTVRGDPSVDQAVVSQLFVKGNTAQQNAAALNKIFSEHPSFKKIVLDNKTPLGFVLFGNAAVPVKPQDPTSFYFPLKKLLTDNGNTIIGMPDMKQFSKSVTEVKTVLGNNKCKEPLRVQIFFENNSKKVVDYDSDDHAIMSKLMVQWKNHIVADKANPFCTPTKPLLMSLVSFASKLGNAKGNAMLGRERSRSTLCLLLHEIQHYEASNSKKHKFCANWVAHLGSFGDKLATMPQGAAIDTATYDRRTEIDPNYPHSKYPTFTATAGDTITFDTPTSVKTYYDLNCKPAELFTARYTEWLANGRKAPTAPVTK